MEPTAEHKREDLIWIAIDGCTTGFKGREMERREEILRLIRQRPGMTFRELARELGIGIGDLQYHLRRLEREGKVFSKRMGRRRYLFPTGFEEEAGKLLVAMATETRRELLLLLIEGPKSQWELAEMLGVSQPTVSYHVKELEKLGVIESERRGKTVVYRLTLEPELILRVIRDYRPGIWERLAENLVDILASMGGGE
jgi:predicted transcriptional regulator